MVRRRRVIGGVVGVLGTALVAGCGSDDGGEEGTPTDEPAETPVPATTRTMGSTGTPTGTPTGTTADATPAGEGEVSLTLHGTGSVDQFESLVVALETVTFTDADGGAIGITGDGMSADIAAGEDDSEEALRERFPAGDYTRIELSGEVSTARLADGGDDPVFEVDWPITVGDVFLDEPITVEGSETSFVTIHLRVSRRDSGAWTLELQGIGVG